MAILAECPICHRKQFGGQKNAKSGQKVENRGNFRGNKIDIDLIKTIITVCLPIS